MFDFNNFLFTIGIEFDIINRKLLKSKFLFITYIFLIFNKYKLWKTKKLLVRLLKENQFLFKFVLKKEYKGIRLFFFLINFCFLK